MKKKLKYILPISVILVLVWGLLEVAEKAALLISITVLTSYLLYQYREDKKLRRAYYQAGGQSGGQSGGLLLPGEDSPLLEIAPLEDPFDVQARNSLTTLLRASLKLNQGRFKQDIEESNRIANSLVEQLEKEQIAPQDCPGLVQEMEKLASFITRHQELQEQEKKNPAVAEELHAVRAKIRKTGEKLHKWAG